ncbi:DUF4260 domain-containing protein [Sporolactobacillus pectinivorans]|uniref:DUF4260 domain-containing protein n=1 Tax=Sporolactobacillus pectinivorans TaxID=1591408 RepID=UPI000C25B110|nr:DUF4260 domain-containing protein [Sporolactobacillus pectinivorans]
MKFAQPIFLVKIENTVFFILVLYLYFAHFHYSFFWFIALLLVPDISAIGYGINTTIGAYCYNVFHVLFVPTIVVVLGLCLTDDIWIALGLIWLCHIFMDRMLGYGLKYTDDFKHTYG